MVRYIPTFGGRRHSPKTREKLALVRRGKSYAQIFGPVTAEYLKALRRQQAQRQPMNPKFTFKGWRHSDSLAEPSLKHRDGLWRQAIADYELRSLAASLVMEQRRNISQLLT